MQDNQFSQYRLNQSHRGRRIGLQNGLLQYFALPGCFRTDPVKLPGYPFIGAGTVTLVVQKDKLHRFFRHPVEGEPCREGIAPPAGQRCHMQQHEGGPGLLQLKPPDLRRQISELLP
ncbi:hypothetical protein D3C75_942280 [compost metagenome]